MLFKDIRPFTGDANYRADFPLCHLEEGVQGYLDQGLDMNPDFQRAHVWTGEQRSSFVEYLLRGGPSGRTIYFNHPGWMRDFEGSFVLVDGKQRLDACLGFLRDKVPAFGHTRSEYTDRLPILNTLVFAVNTLRTRAEVLQWYLDLNTGGTIHTGQEIKKVRLLLEAELRGGA